MAGRRISMKRAFFEVALAFRSGSWGLSTVSRLVCEIREWHESLTNEQIEALLEIPIDVLENDVELSASKDSWQESMGEYYASKMFLTKTGYYGELRSKFLSKTFELWDICALTQYVQTNYRKLRRQKGWRSNLDYVLRIPEVTIRDEVRLIEGSKLLDCGDLLAGHIEEALGFGRRSGNEQDNEEGPRPRSETGVMRPRCKAPTAPPTPPPPA